MTYIMLTDVALHALAAENAGMAHIVEVGGETVSVFVFAERADTPRQSLDRCAADLESMEWREIP